MIKAPGVSLPCPSLTPGCPVHTFSSQLCPYLLLQMHFSWDSNQQVSLLQKSVKIDVMGNAGNDANIFSPFIQLGILTLLYMHNLRGEMFGWSQADRYWSSLADMSEASVQIACPWWHEQETELFSTLPFLSPYWKSPIHHCNPSLPTSIPTLWPGLMLTSLVDSWVPSETHCFCHVLDIAFYTNLTASSPFSAVALILWASVPPRW